MIKRFIGIGIILFWPIIAISQWLNISEISIRPIQTEYGGPLIEISYTLNDEELNENQPAYVFIHYSHPPLLQRLAAMEGRKK